MSLVRGKTITRFAGRAAVIAVAGVIPLTMGALAEVSGAQTLAFQPVASMEPAPADARTVATDPPAQSDERSGDSADSAMTESAQSIPSAPATLTAELICMAKVVHHEAGSEPRAGKLAVAQLLLKRVRSGRFASSVCGVANQRGQFFNTASYEPARDSARWQSAVEVSLEAMAGTSGEVAPGALFFHSAMAAPSSFFRSRQRVATIGHQVFYR